MSLRASWAAANGLLGALLGGVAMNWYGVLPIVIGTSTAAISANWAVSFIIYGIGVWLGLFLLSTIIVAPYQLWRRNEKVADKKKTRLALASFMPRCTELMNVAVTENNVVYDDISAQSQEWADAVEQILLDSLDESYVAIFRDGSDLPMSALYIPPNFDNEMERRGLWSGLRIRAARLQQFIKELSDD